MEAVAERAQAERLKLSTREVVMMSEDMLVMRVDTDTEIGRLCH